MSAAFSLTESSVRTGEGIRLSVRRAQPADRARASVLIIHGLGEHSSRYLHVAESLCARGLAVVLFDLRGHGRSEGKRGHVENYAQLLDDIALVWAESQHESVPHFLYGHSAGGQLALNFALARKVSIAGVIAASPWLELAFAPARWRRWLARATVWFRPDFTQQTDLNPERLSRDLGFLAALPDADLLHHRISARMFFEMTKGAAQARAQAVEMTQPLLMLHGDRDAVTSTEATRNFFNAAGSTDKTLRIYPEGRHETHNDLDREIVLRELGDWIGARC